MSLFLFLKSLVLSGEISHGFRAVVPKFPSTSTEASPVSKAVVSRESSFTSSKSVAPLTTPQPRCNCAWHEEATITGERYYYSPVTGKTQFKRPLSPPGTPKNKASDKVGKSYANDRRAAVHLQADWTPKAQTPAAAKVSFPAASSDIDLGFASSSFLVTKTNKKLSLNLPNEAKSCQV